VYELVRDKEIDFRVKEVLADKVAVPLQDIQNTSSLSKDLGMDSFIMLEVGFAMEEAFNISVMTDADTFPKMQTVEDVVSFVRLKVRNPTST
jgi:acyl carrier protein